jgi:hypothetical protein
VSNTDRAHQNREYVRRLLRKKQPQFAAALEWVVWELTRTCDAPSGNRRRRSYPQGHATGGCGELVARPWWRMNA